MLRWWKSAVNSPSSFAELPFVRERVRGSHEPGPVSGVCFAHLRSSWSPPLAPPAPPPVARHCSSASRLLWRSQTSHGRASSASAPRLPDADRRSARHERCRSAVGPPGSRTRSVCTCQGLRPRRIVRALANGAPVRMAFHIRNCVGIRDDRSFAVQWLACALPCRRFAGALADACARLGADVDRYSFTVRDLHPLLLAGLPAHSENLHNNRRSCARVLRLRGDGGTH
jgi:hypothetical protein